MSKVITPLAAKSKPVIIHNTHKKAGKLITLPQHQSETYLYQKTLVCDVMQPPPNNNSLSGSQTMIKYYLQKYTLGKIDSAVLRFSITANTNSVLLAPVPFWFNRIEFYNRNTGTEISRIYNDMLMMFLNAVPDELTKQWATLCGYDGNTYKQSQNYQNANETRYYYLPLPVSLLDSMGVNLHNVDHDIEIRLFPESTSIIAGTGTITLNEVAGIFEEEKSEHQVNTNASRKYMLQHVQSHNFIDTQQYMVTGVVMNSSTAYQFFLDQFNTVSGALALVIRPSGVTNVSNGNQKYMNLYNGNIDILNTTGDSLYGNGTSVQADYLKNIIVGKHWSNRYFQDTSVYVIPFGDLDKQLSGAIDGHHHFKGNKERLQITTPPVGTPETQVFTFSLAATGGTFQITYKNETTDDLAFDATTIVIAAAINRLSTVISDDITVSVNQSPVSLTLTITQSITRQAIKLKNTFSMFSKITNAAGNMFPVTKTVTSAVNGWINGTYDVSIYNLYFRTAFIVNGHLVTEDVV